MALAIVETRAITGGVDTHAGAHVAAALDPIGGLLGVRQFPATTAGYGHLLEWLGGFGTVCLVGIEGTGSYGAGLARHIPSPSGDAIGGVHRINAAYLTPGLASSDQVQPLMLAQQPTPYSIAGARR
jgi:hypothetical protein